MAIENIRTSKSFKLDGNDIGPIVKGILVAAAGAALTYITKNMTGWDFGTYTPIVVAFMGTLANIARKWLTNYSGNEG